MPTYAIVFEIDTDGDFYFDDKNIEYEIITGTIEDAAQRLKARLLDTIYSLSTTKQYTIETVQSHLYKQIETIEQWKQSGNLQKLDFYCSDFETGNYTGQFKIYKVTLNNVDNLLRIQGKIT